jgi:CheY-like chemotaxis protein
LEPRPRRSCSIIPSVASPSRISTKRYACEGVLRWNHEESPMVGDAKTAAARETSAVGPVRVLVVDDHQAFRHALSSALEMLEDIEVAGQAGGGVAACNEAEQLDPDVIIMDLSMPDLSGIDAMRRIHQRRPDLPVVILTAHADDGTERAAREAGARGFLAKGTGLRDLVDVLHEAAGPAA